MSFNVRSLVLVTVFGTLFGGTLVGCQTSQGSRFGAGKQESIQPFASQTPAMASQAHDSSAHNHASPQQIPVMQPPSVQTAGLSPAPAVRSFSGGSSGQCSSCK